MFISSHKVSISFSGIRPTIFISVSLYQVILSRNGIYFSVFAEYRISQYSASLKPVSLYSAENGFLLIFLLSIRERPLFVLLKKAVNIVVLISSHKGGNKHFDTDDCPWLAQSLCVK